MLAAPHQQLDFTATELLSVVDPYAVTLMPEKARHYRRPTSSPLPGFQFPAPLWANRGSTNALAVYE
jgi:hypothetical protein